MNDAIFSSCGDYRYRLTRRIQQMPHRWNQCLFIMLNPSVADAEKDDPTIRRCIGYAERWGCTGLTVCNLFGLRATDPKKLLKAKDPVGPENHEHLIDQLARHHQDGTVIVAWGGNRITRRLEALQGLIASYNVYCLDTNRDGSPKHPLYCRADLTPKRWSAPQYKETVCHKQP